MAATWMLCLDASAPRTCVALGQLDADGLQELQVADELEDRANQTSTTLELRLRAALTEAGITIAQLGAIACGRGPGTFTGSRVAVATAKGLAVGLGLPIVPVSTLASLAASSPIDGRVLALLDARREQVYGGVFEVAAAVIGVGEERVIELASLLQARDDLEQLLPIGPGCGPYADQMPTSMRDRSLVSSGPTAKGLWRASVSAWRSGTAVDSSTLSVCYLRESYAEMGIHKPKRPRYTSPFVG